MDINKPKPWRGWSEFVKEIGTIVIGVLIALGGEQLVENLHQRHDLQEGREAILHEIAGIASMANVSLREDHCLLGVADRIDDWAKGGPKPPPVPPIFPPFNATIWDASQTGAVTHMPLKEKFAYAAFYERVRTQQTLRARQASQSIDLTRVAALDKLTPAEARSLTQDVGAIRSVLQTKMIISRQILDGAAELGQHPEPIIQRHRDQLARACEVGHVPLGDLDGPPPT
jgi:hypothetical protein